MSISHYTTDDLLADESFRRWVLFPDHETIRWWEGQLAQHPEKEADVLEARRILLTASKVVNQQTVEDGRLDALWQKIQHSVANAVTPAPPAAEKLRNRGDRLWKVAASVALLISASLALWYTLPTSGERRVATADNERQTLILPDGSRVILNGSSELRYRTDWSGDTREVWLKGEAFFQVKKLIQTPPPPSDASELVADKVQNPTKVKFVVHTTSLDVEVYGTRFSVSSEPQKSQVVLQSGEVTVNTADNQRIVMLPGDFVEVRQGSTVHKRVNSQLYTAWKEEKIVFEQVPVAEVAAWIQDRYNRKVLIKTPSLDSLRLTATLPNDNLEVLLETLSLIYHLHIEQPDRRTITIE